MQFNLMQVLSTVNSSNLILHQIFTLYGTRIEAHKRELVWAMDKWLPVINNIMLFKTVIPLRD